MLAAVQIILYNVLDPTSKFELEFIQDMVKTCSNYKGKVVVHLIYEVLIGQKSEIRCSHWSKAGQTRTRK
jgi:hypothetical protein